MHFMLPHDSTRYLVPGREDADVGVELLDGALEALLLLLQLSAPLVEVLPVLQLRRLLVRLPALLMQLACTYN